MDKNCIVALNMVSRKAEFMEVANAEMGVIYTEGGGNIRSFISSVQG